MCLWLLTACLGLLPSQPSPTLVVVGAPQPILLPVVSTTAAATTVATTITTTTTTLRPGTVTGQPLTTNPSTLTTQMPPMTPVPGGSTPPPGGSTPPPGGSTPPPGGSTPPPGGSTPGGTPPPPPPSGITTNTSPFTTRSNPNTVQGGPDYLILCNDPNVVCVANLEPFDAGPPIDPRLGTTPPQQYQAPIVGYVADAPSFDTAVKFPSSRRRKRQSCSCVPAGTCPTQTGTGGAGLIDFRIVTPVGGQCPAGQVYCCPGGVLPGAAVACGVRQPVPAITNINPAAGQATFGDYPWQALILTKQNDYIGGGVLVDQYNVITVTHRILPYIVSGAAPNVKVRLGEWDAGGTYEPLPYQEYTVLRAITHPSYSATTLQYDLAVLRLTTPVPFTPTAGAALSINRACLPPSSTTTYVGQRCYVSGWGKNAFGTVGQYQQILKQVDVPIVDSAVCESQLRAARLGTSYVLDRTSFLCAGGEANKDSCTGDGGSGLVCQAAGGGWAVVGLVAWGLGCAGASVPGVYVNLPALLPWLQQQLAA